MGYGFEGYAQAEFRDLYYNCSGGIAPDLLGFLPTFLPNTPILRGNTINNQLTNASPGGCVVDLNSILDYFQLMRPFWMIAVILIGYLLFFHVVTYLGFLWLTKKEKR